MLLIEMDTPGITIRPITGINGGHELNEVILDNVRIPANQIVGERGQGWTYAKYLLSKERTASAMLYANKRDLEKARAIARREQRGNTPLAEIPEFARKIAEVEIDLLALEWSVLRILADAPNAHNADAVVSALKNRGSEMQQRVTGLQMELLGTKALRDFESERNGGAELPDTQCWPDYVPGRSSAFIYQRAATLYGGSREVQKNIIAKLAFGL
jgi:alkylation response protein AidB-like acyl-CoA dehydrogenase